MQGGGPWTRWVRRPTPAEWVLVAYLAIVSTVTLGHALGLPEARSLASTPDDVAGGRFWSLASSGLVAEGLLLPQVLGTLILGVAAIRLAGGGVFWIAAVVGHLLGTILVYVGVWIGDVAAPSAVGALTRESDFGISLVWCAALGVLAAVGWLGTKPLTRWGRVLLCVWPPAALVAISAVSGGLAFYEHIVAFFLAAAVVVIADWRLDRAASGPLDSTGGPAR